LTLHYNDSSRLEEVQRLIIGAYAIDDAPPAKVPRVHKVLSPSEGDS
jgi:hypothetical protein